MQIWNLFHTKPTEFSTTDSTGHVITRAIVHLDDESTTTWTWFDVTFCPRKKKTALEITWLAPGPVFYVLAPSLLSWACSWAKTELTLDSGIRPSITGIDRCKWRMQHQTALHGPCQPETLQLNGNMRISCWVILPVAQYWGNRSSVGNGAQWLCYKEFLL